MESGICWPDFQVREVMADAGHGLTRDSDSEEGEWSIRVELVNVEQQVLPLFRETFPSDSQDSESKSPNTEGNCTDNLLEVDVATSIVPTELFIQEGGESEYGEEICFGQRVVIVSDLAHRVGNRCSWAGPACSHFF